jgi:hypothetical protein
MCSWMRNGSFLASGHVGHNNINRLGGYIAQNAIEVEIRLQPPNSPDLNLFDLTFFRSLDRAVYWMKDQAQNMVQLMQVVIGCFEEYDPGTLEHDFGHLFAVFRSILQNQIEVETNFEHMITYGNEFVMDIL